MASLGVIVFGSVYPVIMLFCLTRPSVRAAFTAASRAQSPDGAATVVVNFTSIDPRPAGRPRMPTGDRPRGWIILVRTLAAVATLAVAGTAVWWWWIAQRFDLYYAPY